MRMKTCCVTGHRKIDETKIELVKTALRTEIMSAIEEGYTHFISGFAEGVDLYFAEIVVELKKQYNLTLEVAIPYRNRVNSSNPDFKRLLQCCDSFGVHSETYTPACFMMRNRFMIQSSDRVIAVYDGREKGGTLFTMRYANVMEKEIKVISI